MNLFLVVDTEGVNIE